MLDKRPRILFACGRESTYVRNHIALQALRSLAETTAIVDDRAGPLLSRLLRVFLRLIPALRTCYDLIFLGFYAHPLVPLVRRLTTAPILFDAFVSTWDTLCFDRRVFSPDSVRGRLAKQLDRIACHAADYILIDTNAHAAFFTDAFQLPAEKIGHWYVGCDETIFRRAPFQPRAIIDPLIFLFYGTHQPLHGVDVIIEAAALLKYEPRVQFVLIGDGQTSALSRKIASDKQLTNIEFHEPMPITSLASMIAASDICLAGPFGSTPKAKRVIPGKTSQFLAMARPVIAGDSNANRELLIHGESAYLCPQADPQALANAILHLASDQSLRRRLATGGRRLFEERLSVARLTADLAPIIDRAVHTRAPRDASN